MRNILTLAVIALVLAVVGPKLAERFAPALRAGTRPAATVPAEPARGVQANMLAVPSSRDGHFRLNATIGGRALDFMVDTGASIVALTRKDADRLGLNPAARDYTVRIQTANGTVNAARVRLASITVGPLTVYDVEAVVMPDRALGQNLLGMSFLSRLRRFEFRTGQLLLEQ